MYDRNKIWYHKDKIVIIETNVCMNVSCFCREIIWLKSKSDNFIMQMDGHSFPKNVLERLMKNV